MGFNIARYRDIEEKIYEMEIVTPMFLGGADQNDAELRIPSIKGMLRFWWRALYGTDDLEQTIKNESEIFGNTDYKSPTTISFKNQNISISNEKLDNNNFSIYEYLAYGYRVKNNIKNYIEPKSSFSLKLSTLKMQEIENSINALCSFGGLGSKSRNGFGSLKIIDSKKFNTLDFLNQFRKRDMTTYTTISKQSKILFGKQHKTWKEALAEIGELYKQSKYFLKYQGDKRQLIAKSQGSRYAKPYFLHISKLDNDQYQGQILFMPYEYKDSSKTDEYLDTCEQMNEKIEELAGGNKWQ
ncbi:CRISPR-associated protein TM1795 family protein [Flexistipes sinusarabici DSM 4947]|uniref:CRISPR-associated protein TM1795 family protein n=1 Tax=Flexistipes sinusarabici (strain ATCC 49648 / DSM 4947 / MAS 10) TaxID=717231 RepID=F8E949_FLESM|nr:type III-B CRISPR module RAMP protein Cmr1 [Flexistipes sinusarabici]AEI15251.1 CRISPR-associated protein TM1795 family protein [Flexistipes sinusarabici DSM 4947]